MSRGAAGIKSLVRRPGSFPALLLAALLLPVGCGGDEEARQETTPPSSSGTTVGGSNPEDDARAGSLEGGTFVLDQALSVPPRFEAAYQRGVPIVVEFFQQGQDPYYPQGLEVDDMVNEDLTALRDDYPQVEFFTYGIDNPGTGEDLERGEYGSLAAQLDVGYTPFVAMLAPREEGYFVEHVFQGYVERAVLGQALHELSTEVRGNASYVPLDLEGVELAEGGVEYFTVTNRGEEEWNLSNFTLNAVNPETGEVASDEGLRINAGASLAPGQTAFIGRAMDTGGREAIGAFEGGTSFTVEPGDVVALLDGGGAVVDTVPVREPSR